MVSFKDLSNKFVICAGGFDLGQINGVEINVDTWQITHLHVKLSKSASEDLGFRKRIGSFWEMHISRKETGVKQSNVIEKH